MRIVAESRNSFTPIDGPLKTVLKRKAPDTWNIRYPVIIIYRYKKNKLLKPDTGTRYLFGQSDTSIVFNSMETHLKKEGRAIKKRALNLWMNGTYLPFKPRFKLNGQILFFLTSLHRASDNFPV